ncbi:MAG: Fe-Mn family superoxide dismutase [Candidatus Moranbacteria bacterium]|nr:Fe-Mn family superoxide dismutase [Candidatus Moranbacteria bacterium]
MFEYPVQNFEHLLGLPGMSDALLTNHFALYQGYVANTNTLRKLLSEAEAGTPAFNELTRRFGWEWNGMRLHELYFANLSKVATTLSEGALKEKIVAQFGSVENWQKAFLATGAMRGIGWVILCLDDASGELMNVWINEHDLGHLAGTTPLVVMDVFEHAFMLDYGIKRADYLNVFMNALNWPVAEQRFLDSQNRNA